MIRRKIISFLLINLVAVSILVHSFWPLLCLLAQDGHGDRISRAELPAPGSAQIDDMQQLVPKIIHQTYITCHIPHLINGSCTAAPIPEMWTEAWHSCKDLHKDYEYKVWTGSVEGAKGTYAKA